MGDAGVDSPWTQNQICPPLTHMMSASGPMNGSLTKTMRLCVWKISLTAKNRFATAIETLLMHSNRSLRCKMDVHGQTQAATLQIHWLKRLSICTGSWQDKYLVIDCLCTVIFNKCSEYF